MKRNCGLVMKIFDRNFTQRKNFVNYVDENLIKALITKSSN